jgi:hypothetical protein
MLSAISRRAHWFASEKTPLPSNRNCSFAENWVIPAAGYPKRRKGMTPWTMAQSLGDSLGQFRVDGLQMLSFAIIKIGGVRDLIRLRQEECQFIGTAI